MGKRRILVGTAVVALLAVAAPQAIALDATVTTSIGEEQRRARLDLTGVEDRSTSVDAAATLPEQATGIGPGSHLLTTIPGPDGGTFGCTASYVYQSGADLLLAAAGHCFLPETATATDGPGADHDPSASVVEVCVADCSFGGFSGFIITGQLVTLGDIVYARQASAGGDQVGHDFGLVRIPPALHDQIRTSMPVFGGPDVVGTLETGEQVCHYGNGVVVGEVFPTMGRTGVGILSEPDAWFAGSPAAPGDSGSAVQTCAPTADGLSGVEAIGTLTHLTALGVAGTTNERSVAMAREDANLSITPVLGALGATEPAEPTEPSKGGKGKGGGKR